MSEPMPMTDAVQAAQGNHGVVFWNLHMRKLHEDILKARGALSDDPGLPQTRSVDDTSAFPWHPTTNKDAATALRLIADRLEQAEEEDNE